jgi:YHS domain-containing protein
MGKPVKVTQDGTDVYLCCKSCLKNFNKEPAKYVAMVKAAQTR